MITIEITRTIREVRKVRENLLSKETPTDRQDDYHRTIMAREFIVGEVERIDHRTVTLLQQEIEDESRFDLAAVIKAINGIGADPWKGVWPGPSVKAMEGQ